MLAVDTAASRYRYLRGIAQNSDQTRTTENWTVESHDLRVTEEGEWAWFADDVRMAWDDSESDEHHDHRTRWSGALRRADGWRFVGMHVSVPGEA